MTLLTFESFEACHGEQFDGIELTQLLPVFGASYRPYERPMMKWFTDRLCNAQNLVQGRDYLLRYYPLNCGIAIFISPACAHRLVSEYNEVSELARSFINQIQRYADQTGRLVMTESNGVEIIDGPAFIATE